MANFVFEAKFLNMANFVFEAKFLNMANFVFEALFLRIARFTFQSGARNDFASSSPGNEISIKMNSFEI